MAADVKLDSLKRNDGRPTRASAKELLLVAAWFGLVTGIVEGIGMCSMQRTGLMTWKMSQKGVTVEFIWIAIIIDFVLFVGVGLGLTVLARLLPRLPITRASIFVFLFMTSLNWLRVPDRMHWLGVLVMALGLTVVSFRWIRKNEARVMLFWRKTLPWALGAGVLAFTGIQGGLWLTEQITLAQLPQAPPGAPNILFIILDAVRADHLSAYGYERATSPNVDRLAREGVLFENAFATSCWSPPSHASLVTGRFLYEHGMEWDKPRLDGRFQTLAEYLLAQGYRTAASSGNQHWFSRPRGFGRGFIRFGDFYGSPGDAISRTIYGRMLPFPISFRPMGIRKLASEVNRDAMQWIRRDPTKPFFLMLNYIDSHAAYIAPEPFRDNFRKHPRQGSILDDANADYSQITKEQLEEEIGAYDGTIAYSDHQISLLMSDLEKLGLAENTLVIITADHGESFGEHGSFMHRNDLYREVIRVPLIIWWPGKVPANMRISRPVSNAAIPATIEDLLGRKTSQAFPGWPLTQLWKSPESAEDWPWPLVELSQQPFPERWRLPSYYGWMKSLISPQWHYIVHQTRGAQLYDWNSDPEERHDLAGTPEGRSIIREFSEKMKAVLAQPSETQAWPVRKSSEQESRSKSDCCPQALTRTLAPTAKDLGARAGATDAAVTGVR